MVRSKRTWPVCGALRLARSSAGTSKLDGDRDAAQRVVLLARPDVDLAELDRALDLRRGARRRARRAPAHRCARSRRWSPPWPSSRLTSASSAATSTPAVRWIVRRRRPRRASPSRRASLQPAARVDAQRAQRQALSLGLPAPSALEAPSEQLVGALGEGRGSPGLEQPAPGETAPALTLGRRRRGEVEVELRQPCRRRASGTGPLTCSDERLAQVGAGPWRSRSSVRSSLPAARSACRRRTCRSSSLAVVPARGGRRRRRRSRPRTSAADASSRRRGRRRVRGLHGSLRGRDA